MAPNKKSKEKKKDIYAENPLVDLEDRSKEEDFDSVIDVFIGVSNEDASRQNDDKSEYATKFKHSTTSVHGTKAIPLTRNGQVKKLFENTKDVDAATKQEPGTEMEHGTTMEHRKSEGGPTMEHGTEMEHGTKPSPSKEKGGTKMDPGTTMKDNEMVPGTKVEHGTEMVPPIEDTEENPRISFESKFNKELIKDLINSGVRKNALRLMLCFLNTFNYEREMVSIRQVSKDYGISRARLYPSLKELEEAELIATTKTPEGHYLVRLLLRRGGSSMEHGTEMEQGGTEMEPPHSSSSYVDNNNNKEQQGGTKSVPGRRKGTAWSRIAFDKSLENVLAVMYLYGIITVGDDGIGISKKMAYALKKFVSKHSAEDAVLSCRQTSKAKPNNKLGYIYKVMDVFDDSTFTHKEQEFAKQVLEDINFVRNGDFGVPSLKDLSSTVNRLKRIDSSIPTVNDDRSWIVKLLQNKREELNDSVAKIKEKVYEYTNKNPDA